MLRFSYIPSDFNPMMLVLGEAEDLRQLAALLRIVARGGEAVPLEAASFSAPSDTSVLVAPGGGPSGLVAIDAAAKRFRWALDAAEAEAAADLVASLADPARKAGSEVIDPDPTGGGIPIKVSRGEFADDFLLTVHP